MRASGVPIDRINLGVFAIHPEMAGYAVAWDTSMAEAVEIPVRREDTLTSTYLQSPIKVLVEERRELSLILETKMRQLLLMCLRIIKPKATSITMAFL